MPAPSRVDEMSDDELIAHIGLPPAVLSVRGRPASPSTRQAAREGDQARSAARPATPEQIAESRARISARLAAPRQPEVESAPRPTFRSAPATPRQFEGVGQPDRPKEGEFYAEHRHGYTEESKSFGWRAAMPDSSKVPYHGDIRSSDFGGSSSAAVVTMTRRLDEHYALPDANVHDYHEEREDGHQQGVMLESSKAKPWKVNEMYSTKDARHMSNVLLGLAAEHSLKTSGRVPAASNDLSKHSTRVVHRLAEAGVIEPPKNEHRNNLDWQHGANSATSGVDYMARNTRDGYTGNERLTTEQGMHGGRVMRQVIRGARSVPVERGLPEPQPPVNARSEAGRYQEFKHHQELQAKYDKPKSNVSPEQGTLF